MWLGTTTAGFADQAEPAELHRADHHLGGLAGADLVKQPDGGLGEHPRDRGALMRQRREGARQAGEGEPLALGGVVAQHDRVEPAVVLAGEPAGAVGVLPAPLAKRSCIAWAFSWAAAVSVGFDHAAAVVGLVGDLDRALLEHGLGERRGGHAARFPTRCVACTLQLRPLTAHIAPPGCSTWMSGSSRISARNWRWVSASIHTAPSRGSISSHRQIRRQHPLQRAHVDLELRPVDRCAGGRARAWRARSRTGTRPRAPAAARGVVVDELAELLPRVLLGRCRAGGRSRRARRGRGCPGRSRARPAACRRRAAGRGAPRPAPVSIAGRRGGLGGLVEGLEGLHERGERVGAQQPDRWRCDAGHRAPRRCRGRCGRFAAG